MSIHVTRAPTVPLTSYDTKRSSHLKSWKSIKINLCFSFYKPYRVIRFVIQCNISKNQYKLRTYCETRIAMSGPNLGHDKISVWRMRVCFERLSNVIVSMIGYVCIFTFLSINVPTLLLESIERKSSFGKYASDMLFDRTTFRPS